MGQAKRRGDFEQRREQSVKRKEAERKRKEEDELLRWNSLTDEQQAAERKARTKASRKAAHLAMLGGFYSDFNFLELYLQGIDHVD